MLLLVAELTHFPPWVVRHSITPVCGTPSEKTVARLELHVLQWELVNIKHNGNKGGIHNHTPAR